MYSEKFPIFVSTKTIRDMKDLRTETVKRELSGVNIYEAIQIATKIFSDACYDEGLSVEKARKLMHSKQGLDIIAKKAAELI